MQIELYKFSKRINSTKRPTAGSGFTTQCTIKQNAPYVGTFGSSSDTTVCYPVLFLTGVDDPNAYNYCKAFGDRYYFIRDIQIDINGAATLHCEIDVLATRKNEILASSQYVTYSSSDYDLKIPDARMPKKNGYTIKHDVGSVGILSIANPTYIINCITRDSNLTSTWAMNIAQMRDFASWLCDPINQSALQQALQLFFAPADAIISISVSPFDFTGLAEQFYMGNVVTGLTATKLDYTDTFIKTGTLTVTPERDELSYLDGDSWSTYQVTIPYCGAVNIPAGQLMATGALEMEYYYYVQYGTGEVYCLLMGEDGTRLAFASGNCYSPMPWGENGNVIANTALSGLQAILGTISLSSATSAYEAFTDSHNITTRGGKIQPHTRNANTSSGDRSNYNLTVGGSLGSFGNEMISGIIGSAPAIANSSAGVGFSAYLFNTDIYFYKYTSIPGSSDITAMRPILGLPCNKYRSLSGLSGFCQCKSPSIVIDDLKVIAELINGYLSSGFFIE